MSQQIPPQEQLVFRGVHTAGNPIQRPRNTASVCENFRIMPGGYLRLAGGRTRHGSTDPLFQAGGTILQLQRLHWQGVLAAQIRKPDDSVAWKWLHLPNYIFDPTNSEPIATAYDSAYARTFPAAYANLRDRIVLYNGLGVQDGVTSKPPFSTTDKKYFGLDAYAPNGNPSASFTAGGGYNSVLDQVTVYVGLYDASTEHYSNGVLAGSIGAQGAMGTINVTGLGNLKYATHGIAETGSLYYVFYATIDGGAVPYLILSSDYMGPYKVPVAMGSASLSVSSGTNNGWVLDLTKEMPTENFPPRPMSSLSYVNGRLYGTPMSGGSGSAYQWGDKDYAGVAWSAALGDTVDRDFLGDPLQSWPLTNIAYTPSNEQPVVSSPDATGSRVIVLTKTSAFYLTESADGLHEWETISRVHGIVNPATLMITRYGVVWVDQYQQIVMLNGATIEVLSRNYQNLLAGKTPRCADYLVDPTHDVDRYQVWLSDGTAVIHDFAIGGEAYTVTDSDFTAAISVIDFYGQTHHIVAKDWLYTHEGQPDMFGVDRSRPVPTRNQNADGSFSEITGTYVRNWDDWGDANLRKELVQVDVIGDGAASAAIGGSPLSVEWYADFEEVTAANKKTVAAAKAPQSTTDSSWRFKFATGHRFWYKLALKLRGHSTDNAAFANYTSPATEGDKAKNFYGSIVRLLAHIGVERNRA